MVGSVFGSARAGIKVMLTTLTDQDTAHIHIHTRPFTFKGVKTALIARNALDQKQNFSKSA